LTLIRLIIAAAAALMSAIAPSSAAGKCPPVSLAVSPGRGGLVNAFAPSSRPFRKTSLNFGKAYAKACGEGLLDKKPLASRGKLFLTNAPEANVASIYPYGRRTLLEYWFITGDGKTNVPSVGELLEAIFCAVHGASAKEQEESGRCLPD
jgi:hypothetical protein